MKNVERNPFQGVAFIYSVLIGGTKTRSIRVVITFGRTAGSMQYYYMWKVNDGFKTPLAINT